MDTQLPKPDVEGSNPFARSKAKWPWSKSKGTKVHLDEADHIYHADGGYLNSSKVTTFINEGVSSYYRKHILCTDPPLETPSLAKGRLVHMALELGFDAMGERLGILPEDHCTSTGMSQSRKTLAWLADQDPNIIWVTPADGEYLGHVREEIDRNTAVAELLEKASFKEVSIRYTHEDLKMRCRPDLVCDDGQVCDYKTTKYQDPLKSFWQSCRDYLYHVSHEIYRRGAISAGLPDLPLIYILISTSSARVEAIRLPNALISKGRRVLDRALSELSWHIESGEWTPTSYGEIHELYVPRFLYGEDR